MKKLAELQDVGALSNSNLSFLTAYHVFEQPNLQNRQSAMNANSQKKIIFSLSSKLYIPSTLNIDLILRHIQ